MPVPTFMGKVNKRVFNPMEIRKGKRPVITHRGRTSGRTYHTPLDAHQVDDGFVFILMYGADRSDWVKNVLAAEKATLYINGEEVLLDSPQLLTKDEAVQILREDVKLPADYLNVTEYLRMDVV